MNIDSSIAALLTTYQLPAVLIGSFFLGETVIITAAFLSAHGVWSPLAVFWLALLGTILSDTVWFLLGQQILIQLNRWEFYKKQSVPLVRALTKLTGEKPFLVLLFIKFLYGTRILTIIYLSTRKMKLSTFTLFNGIGTTIWLIVIITIGWLAGKSIIDVLPFLNSTQYIILVLVIILLLVRLVTSWLSKTITKL